MTGYWSEVKNYAFIIFFILEHLWVSFIANKYALKISQHFISYISYLHFHFKTKKSSV